MHVCYWIIGLDTNRPAVAFDRHHDDGELLGETETLSLPRDLTRDEIYRHARRAAIAYALEHGTTRVTHDPDSTDYYRVC